MQACFNRVLSEFCKYLKAYLNSLGLGRDELNALNKKIRFQAPQNYMQPEYSVSLGSLCVLEARCAKDTVKIVVKNPLT